MPAIDVVASPATLVLAPGGYIDVLVTAENVDLACPQVALGDVSHVVAVSCSNVSWGFAEDGGSVHPYPGMTIDDSTQFDAPTTDAWLNGLLYTDPFGPVAGASATIRLYADPTLAPGTYKAHIAAKDATHSVMHDITVLVGVPTVTPSAASWRDHYGTAADWVDIRVQGLEDVAVEFLGDDLKWKDTISGGPGDYTISICPTINGYAVGDYSSQLHITSPSSPGFSFYVPLTTEIIYVISATPNPLVLNVTRDEHTHAAIALVETAGLAAGVLSLASDQPWLAVALDPSYTPDDHTPAGILVTIDGTGKAVGTVLSGNITVSCPHADDVVIPVTGTVVAVWTQVTPREGGPWVQETPPEGGPWVER